MGSRWLTDLADVVRHAGLEVHEVSGWQTRARSSGGFDSGRPTHIMCHHTASGSASDGWPDADYISTGSDIQPISQLYLNRTGEVWVCAAGACNNAGSGGPLDNVPVDSMNTYSIAIEAGNNGVGEPWPEIQQEHYQILVQALCDHYGILAAHVRAHFEWAPTRKIDPAGSSRWATGSASWSMNRFRDDVVAGWPGATPPQPIPTPPGGDWTTEVIMSLPALRQGASGEDVETMQHLLSARGTWSDSPANHDGVFGAGTDQYLRQFQQSRGLTVDGICGQQTWTKLLLP